LYFPPDRLSTVELVWDVVFSLILFKLKVIAAYVNIQ